jgi:phage gp37-like protein
MLSAIEEAIVARIQTKLTEAVTRIDVQRGIEGTPQPAVYVSVEEGIFTRVTDDVIRQTVTIYVDVVFSNLQSEAQRRKGVYPIMEGVLGCLFGQKLGLEITPLAPKSFRNTTTPELKEKGLIAYALELNTSYHIRRMDDEVVTDLLTVGLLYYLQPDDGVADAEDLVTLQVAPAEEGV